MKIPTKKEYEPAPEYAGAAVCVDVTDLEKTESDFGVRETFRIVFEIGAKMKDGRKYVVRTPPLTPSFHEKANLRKFLRGALGKDLSTIQEQEAFDTEDLIGKTFDLTVIHETNDDGRVFDRIALCRPWKGEPVSASGDYTRVKDRKDKDGKPRQKSASRADDDGGTDSDGKESNYRRTESGASPKPSDFGEVKVHIGKNAKAELELRDLSKETITNLIERWLNKDFAKIEKPTAQDKRLAEALRHYEKKYKAPEPEPEPKEEDDVQY